MIGGGGCGWRPRSAPTSSRFREKSMSGRVGSNAK
jgi:hypothetical protein